jgi:hypothetical protein
MAPQRTTSFCKYCFKEVLKLGRHTWGAIERVLAVTAVLVFLAFLAGQMFGSGEETQASVAGWLNTVPWWAYISIILAITWYLSIRAQYGAYIAAERRAIKAEDTMGDQYIRHRIRDIVTSELEDATAMGTLNTVATGMGARANSLVSWSHWLHDWINDTHAKLASVSEYWAQMFGGSTDIVTGNADYLSREAMRRKRLLSDMRQLLMERESRH